MLDEGDSPFYFPVTKVQGSAKRLRPGLVNFVTAVAYHFCLAMPAAFKQPGASTLAGLCITKRRGRERSKVMEGLLELCRMIKSMPLGERGGGGQMAEPALAKNEQV